MWHRWCYQVAAFLCRTFVKCIRPTYWTKFVQLCPYPLAAEKSQADLPVNASTVPQIKRQDIEAQMAGAFWYGIHGGHAQTQPTPPKLCPSSRRFLKNPLTNVQPDCNLISSLPWAEPFFWGGQAYCLASVLRI